MTDIFKFNALLKRNARRGLVVAALGTFTLYFVMELYGDKSGNAILVNFFYWMLFLRLSRSTSLFRTKSRKMDERQQSLRNQAFYLAYLVAASFAILICSLDFFGVGASQRYLNGNIGFTSFTVYVNMCLVTLLPFMYVAWLEPDPLAEDRPVSTAGKEHA